MHYSKVEELCLFLVGLQQIILSINRLNIKFIKCHKKAKIFPSQFSKVQSDVIELLVLPDQQCKA